MNNSAKRSNENPETTAKQETNVSKQSKSLPATTKNSARGNKMIFTDIGLNLIKEVEEDNVNVQDQKRRQIKVFTHKKKIQNDESIGYINQVLQENNQKASPSISQKIQLATHPNKVRNVRSMECLFKKHLNKDVKEVPYIQKQIQKYSKQIMQPVNSILQQDLNPSNKNNTILYNSINESMDSKLVNSVFMQDDTYALDKYNKIVFAESKIDHIHRRHKEFSKKHQETVDKIKQRYKVIEHQKIDSTIKLDFNDELTKEHGDWIDALQRETRYGFRKEQRNIDYMKGKFVNSWNKFKLPKLTQKSLQNHQRFEKYQNRPVQ